MTPGGISRNPHVDNTPMASGHVQIEKAKSMIENARKEFKVALNIYRKNPCRENEELVEKARSHLVQVYDEFKEDIIFSWINTPDMQRHNLRSRII